MYLTSISELIRLEVPPDRVPSEGADELFLLYALLLEAKGANVTCNDIHDAWSIWMDRRNAGHPSIRPFNQLAPDVQREDAIFAQAIRNVAQSINRRNSKLPSFSEVLFPLGVQSFEDGSQQPFELYKIMVASSEGLVARRQGVNTFFLTMTGAILTASGLIVQNSSGNPLSAWGIFVLTISGAILCFAWRSLIVSFGQLNRGKFKVINNLEKHLKAAIFAAEWEALDRGENPSVYRSFTSREIWVPNSLIILFVLAAAFSLMWALGLFEARSSQSGLCVL